MKWTLFLLGLTASVSASANGKAYLNIEDGKVVSVFSQPGKNWKNCTEQSGCAAVAWPTNSAEIEVLSSSPRSMRVADPTSGKMQDESYVEIKYKYFQTVNGQRTLREGRGWVDSAYVTQQRRQSTYSGNGSRGSKSTATAAEECAPTASKAPATGGVSAVRSTVTPLTAALERSTLEDAAKKLESEIGKCVINPSRPPTNYAAGLPFDSYVLPQLRRATVPRIMKENGQAMSRQDLIDIDALARTLYAEMASCYKHGLHYPMTVAKIAVNRANESSRHGEFIKGSHADDKGTLAKVATSPSQFSLWLKKINGKPNGSLPQALCPPSNKNQAFWTGNNPPPYETDIWDSTLKIATEAVLFPNQFARRTGQVRQFFYTSGMNGFYKMRQVHPTVGNQKVDKNSCVQVWEDSKKS